MRPVSTVLALLILGACSQKISLFPVEGPIANSRDVQVIEGTANGVGVAKDTNGNIYKMLF